MFLESPSGIRWLLFDLVKIATKLQLMKITDRLLHEKGNGLEYFTRLCLLAEAWLSRFINPKRALELVSKARQ